MPNPAVRSILLVDDDPMMLLLCRRFFQHHAPGFRVVEARSGEQALELLRRERYDVVLTDYRMGAVNGTEVLAFALAHQPEALRVLMSGYGDPATVAIARERARIHEFIEKPLGVEDIEAALRTQLLERFFGTPVPRGSVG